jgi:hypothetical protein
MAGTVNSWNNQIAGSYNQIILNAGTNGVAISTDASAATVNVATGAAVKTTTLGSTNSTSATTVQSGSGALNVTSTNGALTINSGTAALGISTDASATTVSFATGAAVKTVTLGSTNSTSSTAIKSGTGNVAINTGLTIDSTGRNYNTVQPAFSAYLSASTANNVTGDGTGYQIIFDTEVFDQGANYNNATGVFTAPIAGKYLFTFYCFLQNLTTSHNFEQMLIITSNRNYSGNYINIANVQVGGSNFLQLTMSAFADMDAADTAYCQIQVGGSTLTVGVFGNAQMNTAFTGALIC